MNKTILCSNDEQLQEYAAAHGVKSFLELENFPKYFQIETVAVCNARCIMCPIEEWRREVNIMEDPLFAKIVDELKNYADWVQRVTIQLDGEPLIDKKLEKRIGMLKDAGIKFVTFNSNSSLMTPDRAESILKSGIDEVTFSIDGSTKETFEKIRRRLNFDSCISNILSMISIRDRMNSNVSIRIRMTVQEANAHEFSDYYAFWKQHLTGPNDKAYGKLVHNWANWLPGYELPESGKSREELNASPCTSPWSSFIVFTDGRVSLCCSDYNARVELGNVNHSTIREIWQGSKINKVRDDHRACGRNSMSMCKDCNVWDPLAKVDQKLHLEI